MVAPRRHTAAFDSLSPGEGLALQSRAQWCVRLLTHVYHPQGFNLGMNLGAVAGAGIAEHLHLHVVPRWGGDTNFMSTTARTRVLPETLDTTLERLKAAAQLAGLDSSPYEGRP
jgi:ATP adenylyltransferase